MSMSLHWISGLFGRFVFFLSLFQLTIYISVCIYACCKWNATSGNETDLDYDSDFDSDSDFEIKATTLEETRKQIMPGARLRMKRS